MSDKQPDWSLKGELRKRRSQEIDAELQRRQSHERPATPTTKPSNGSVVVSQAATPPQDTPQLPLSPDSRSGRKNRWRLGVALGLVILLVGVGLWAILGRFLAKPDTASLSGAEAANAVVHDFNGFDGTVSDVKPLPVPNTLWHADQQVSFTVTHQNETAQFYLLTYTPAHRSLMRLDAVIIPRRVVGWKYFLTTNALVMGDAKISDTLWTKVVEQFKAVWGATQLTLIPGSTATVVPQASQPGPTAIR